MNGSDTPRSAATGAGSALANPSLGVVVISHNEETDLPGFLRNVLPWADEIVVVDDGSTDRTMEIARAAGDKVVVLDSPRSPGEFYADQRNKGIAASTCDWLLHMDVDERVPPDLADEILRAIRNPDFDAFRFRRINYLLHRPLRRGGLSDWNQVHLAKRALLRFTGMYHEGIELETPANRIGQLQTPILHFNDSSYLERLSKSGNYQLEIAERIRKSQRRVGYFDILAAFFLEFGRKYFWKLGILEGAPGLIWALHSASANLRAHVIVWDEQNHIPRETLETEFLADWNNRGRRTDKPA